MPTKISLVLCFLFVISVNTVSAREEKYFESVRMPKRLLSPAIERPHDERIIAKGGELFKRMCAACHGGRAQGHPEWHKRNAKPGVRPLAPPLDDTGHAWLHSKAALIKQIRGGSKHLGGDMPPRGEKLMDDDVEAIISWFQDKWSDQHYAIWMHIDKAAKE